MDKDGKQYTTSPSEKGAKILLKSIREVPFGVFVLDTQLDKGWRSRRQSARFWEEYCYHSDWEFASERVHSLSDLSYVLGKRTIRERVLVFSGHGSTDGWRLSNGECFNLHTDIEVAEANRHKVVVFSSCELGRNRKLCEHYREVLGAEAVVTYRTAVLDPICFLAEPALLQLLHSGYSAAEAVEKVKAAMDPWKTVNVKNSKQFPIVCYSSGV